MSRDFAERLKKLRSESGYPVKQVAAKLNVPVTTYREWEKGRQIKGEPYARIAELFNVTLGEILTGQKSNVSDVIAELDRVQSSLDEIKKRLANFD